jgi:hypothetical protein
MRLMRQRGIEKETMLLVQQEDNKANESQKRVWALRERNAREEREKNAGRQFGRRG